MWGLEKAPRWVERKMGEEKNSFVRREIEKIYEKYEAVSKKKEKMAAVKRIAEILLGRREVEVEWEPEGVGVAEVTFDALDEKLISYEELSELKSFLKFHELKVIITTHEKAAVVTTDEKYSQLLRNMEQLGYKVFLTRDKYGKLLALLPIFSTKVDNIDVYVYLCFEKW